MTLNKFCELSFGEQIAIIKDRGALIGERQDKYATMHLYQIDAFYVELAFTKSDGILWKIGPFDHPVLLQPYLDRIDIGGITS
jgi:hypothetical protein